MASIVEVMRSPDSVYIWRTCNYIIDPKKKKKENDNKQVMNRKKNKNKKY